MYAGSMFGRNDVSVNALLIYAIALMASSVHELESKAVAVRKNWLNGVVTIASDTQSYGSDQKVVWSTHRAAQVFFQADALRVDIQRSDSPERTIRESVLITSKTVLEYTDEKLDTKTIATRLRQPSPSLPRPMIAPDIRLIGLVPRTWEGLTQHSSLSEFVGQPERRNVTTTLESLGEIECVRVEFDAGDVHIRCWLDPSREGVIPQLDVEFGSEPITIKEQIISTWERHSTTGLWVPDKVSYRRIENDKLLMSQDTRIRFSRLNEPFDIDPFAFKNLPIPTGTPIIDDEHPGEIMFWDGTGPRSSSRQAAPQASASSKVVWLLLSALGFFVLGGLLWWTTKKDPSP